MRILKPRKLDWETIWQDTEEKLIKFLHEEEGYSDTYVRESLAPCIDLFERLLIEGVEKYEKE